MRSIKWLMPALAVGLFVALSNRSVRADGSATKPSVGTGTLVVNVVDGNGKAVAGAHVRVVVPPPRHRHGAGNNSADPAPGGPADNNPPAGGGDPNGGQQKPQRPAPIATGVTDANGSITFNDIPAGEYRVAAGLKDVGMGIAMATVAADGTETVTVTLKPRPEGGTH